MLFLLFVTGVIDTDGAPWLVNLKQNLNDPKFIFKSLGADDLWKKPEAKNLVTLSLQNIKNCSAFRNNWWHDEWHDDKVP